MKKNIIFYFSDFDPIDKGHISIIDNAIKKVDATTLYLGLNKSSNNKELTSIYHRKNMLKEYIRTNKTCKLLPFCFDFKNIDLTCQKILDLITIKEADKYYFLINKNQLKSLKLSSNYKQLINRVDFIIIDKISDKNISKINYSYIDTQNRDDFSSLIKEGKYNNTLAIISNYILIHNLYLKQQIKQYLNGTRYKHTLSVAKTALLINEKANLGLDKYKVEKAALLHDIAKNLPHIQRKKLMKEYYPHIDCNEEVYHQYLGEHLAKEIFYVYDEDILNAIKYHTTGRARMSILEKLIYVSDKIEPNRKFNTQK